MGLFNFMYATIDSTTLVARESFRTASLTFYNANVAKQKV